MSCRCPVGEDVRTREDQRGPRWLACALLLALSTWPAGADGPAAGAGEPPTFTEEAEILAVEVPVHVSDAAGNPVRGLTAADFELTDDGERQSIQGLDVVDLEVVSTATAASGRPPALGASARRHLLLLFDLAFTEPAGIARARAAARDFVLTSLHPTDLVAVAVHTLELGPRLLVTFTPDRAQVARALDQLELRQPDRSFDRDPLRFMLGAQLAESGSRLPGGAGTGAGGRASDDAALENQLIIRKQMEGTEKAYERGRIAAWSRGLSELARWLRSVEGRKHVMFFSEGIDSRLMLGRAPDPDDPDIATDQLNLMTGNIWLVDSDDLFGNVGVQNDMARMVDEFRRADCAVEAVDVGGLSVGGEMAKRTSGSGRDALFYVARETGGELYENDNALRRGLERTLSRTSVTYLLSFRPSNAKWDGAYHRLEVELRKGAAPGATVSHRAGYFAPRPFRQLDPQERALLASEAIASAVPRSDVKVDVLAAPFRAGEERAYVPVIIEVGGESLLSGQGGERLSVEIYAYATDERGEMRDYFAQVVGLDLAQTGATLAAGGLKYYGQLALGKGEFLVRVLVRNGETGRSGVVTVPVAVPEMTTERTLLTPFFLEPPGRWLMVRGSEAGGSSESVVYPFTVNGEPFVPAARPTLAPNGRVRVCLVAYNLGSAELEVEARVLDADGRPAGSGRLAGIERTVTGMTGVDKFVAEFEPAGLAAGDYELRLALTDPATGWQIDSAARFAVTP